MCWMKFKLMRHSQNIRIAISFLQLKYFNDKHSDAQQLFFSFSLWACYHMFILFSREKWKISRILHWGFSFKACNTNIWYIIGPNLFWSILTFFFYKLGKKITFFIDWGTQKKRYGKLASHKSKNEDSMWKWRVLQMRRRGRNSFTLVFGIRWRWYYVTRKVPCHS